MAYTETKNTSWLERLGGSFSGIVTGLVLVLLGSWLLWWNEGRTYRTAGAIGEAQLMTQDVKDITTADPALDGKLIHATGRADTQDMLMDQAFGVSATAIKLERNVEYCQWVEKQKSEKRKKLGGGEETVTTYTYSKEWVSSPVNSANFHDPDYNGTYGARGDKGPNDSLASFENLKSYAQNVTFGAYKLPDFFVHSISGAQPMTLRPESVDVAAITAGIHMSELYTRRYNMMDVTSPDQFVHVSGNTIYIGQNPGSPRIGDVRVSFRQTPPADISIIAKVTGNTFEEFIASNEERFSRLSMGQASMEKMFADAKSGNRTMAWILRAVGAIVVILGLRTVFSPLAVLVGVLPILETIVGAGLGVASFLLGLAWSCVVIAVAWVRFRPLLAGGLLAAAAVFFALTFLRGKKNAQDTSAA